jgi:hypothetical protein
MEFCRCGKPPKKIVEEPSNVLGKPVPFWEWEGDLGGDGGTPLPPMPLKGLTGAGSAKMVCKILIRKGLEVKILITKDFDRPPRAFCRPPSPRQ